MHSTQDEDACWCVTRHLLTFAYIALASNDIFDNATTLTCSLFIPPADFDLLVFLYGVEQPNTREYGKYEERFMH